MKGSRWGCPLFFVGATVLAKVRRRSASSPRRWGISRAVPLSSRKNAKGGGQSAQLAFGSNKCRLVTNAFSRELRGSHAWKIMRLSLKADRRLVVAALGKKGTLWRENGDWRKLVDARGPVGAAASRDCGCVRKNNMMKNRKNFCYNDRFFLFF